MLSDAQDVNLTRPDLDHEEYVQAGEIQEIHVEGRRPTGFSRAQPEKCARSGPCYVWARVAADGTAGVLRIVAAATRCPKRRSSP